MPELSVVESAEESIHLAHEVGVERPRLSVPVLRLTAGHCAQTSCLVLVKEHCRFEAAKRKQLSELSSQPYSLNLPSSSSPAATTHGILPRENHIVSFFLSFFTPNPEACKYAWVKSQHGYRYVLSSHGKQRV